MANPNFQVEHIEVEIDGTIPGSVAYLVEPGGERLALSCVCAVDGNGERLECPGIDEDGDVITLKVRGLVRRVPLRPSDWRPEPPVTASIAAPLTADFLWHIHRAALGGKSSVTGAELPQTLAECPPGARAAHYAMALAAARHVDPGAVIPVPAGVAPEEIERVERMLTGIEFYTAADGSPMARTT